MSTNNQSSAAKTLKPPPPPQQKKIVWPQVEDIKDKAPDEIPLGFTVDDLTIGYKAFTVNWALLAKGLNDLDPEVIRDQQARAVFTFWRDAVQASVVASFSQSWMSPDEQSNLQSDIEEYLITSEE